MIILGLVPFRSCCILDEQPQDILLQGCIHFSMLPPFFHVATKTQKTSPSFQHLAYQSLNLVYLSYMLNKCAKGMACLLHIYSTCAREIQHDEKWIQG